jgi:LysM repeat protein
LLLVGVFLFFPVSKASAFGPSDLISWFFSTPASASEEVLAPQVSRIDDNFLDSKGNPNPAQTNAGFSMDDKAFSSETGPSGTIADVEANDHQGKISLYVVHKGDTLAQVAKMFEVTVETILWANNLTSGTSLYEGQLLDILPVDGVQYVVKKGDTIQGITKQYKGKLDEVMEFNDIEVGQKLSVGEIIIIPNGKKVSASAPVSENIAILSKPSVAGYYTHPAPAATRRSQNLHGRVHKGVDFSGPIGTPVYAAAEGVVIQSQFTSSYCGRGCFGDYGNNVWIKHLDGSITVYAHLSAVYFKKGVSVIKGQQIGEMGNTGRSTGSHLHFEVRGASNPGQYGNGFNQGWGK